MHSSLYGMRPLPVKQTFGIGQYNTGTQRKQRRVWRSKYVHPLTGIRHYLSTREFSDNPNQRKGAQTM